MKIKRISAFLLALLLCTATALAATYTENVDYYTEKYGDDFSLYRDWTSGAKDSRITKAGERLKELGYYNIAKVTNDSITNTMALSISLFCQQMGIGGEGKELSKLTQAVLFSGDAQPALFPPPYEKNYSYEQEGKLTVFTLRNLQRLKAGDRCSLRGTVAEIVKVDERNVTLRIELEGTTDAVRVNYRYPERSSRFMVGDKVLAFGTMADPTQGAPVITGELIGFAN